MGSSGRGLSSAAEVDGVTSLRQAGSTLKPFLYQLALERHYLSAASLLGDSPLDLQTGSGLYAPQNYAKDFKGLVSARTALASSLNVPAVRAIEMVGPNALRDRLYRLGLSSLQQDGDYYGYSLALGAADIRLLELANAYRTLAQPGPGQPDPLDAGGPQTQAAASAERRQQLHHRRHPVRPHRPRARAPSAWKARYPPATGARSRPAPARTCATTGRWAFPASAPWRCGWATPPASRCGTCPACTALRRCGRRCWTVPNRAHRPPCRRLRRPAW
ncbi:hypothetical protein JOS77_26540 [Chromobacterium haemolyticum]|nr:hypothetical protein JOS77_26540 [Chromobacterium haemolyticum]